MVNSVSGLKATNFCRTWEPCKSEEPQARMCGESVKQINRQQERRCLPSPDSRVPRTSMSSLHVAAETTSHLSPSTSALRRARCCLPPPSSRGVIFSLAIPPRRSLRVLCRRSPQARPSTWTASFLINTPQVLQPGSFSRQHGYPENSPSACKNARGEADPWKERLRLSGLPLSTLTFR